MRQKIAVNKKNFVKINFQSLESRCMLSAVTVNGSNSAEEIRVYVASNTIIVDVDGNAQSFPDFLYDGIVINALGGADTIIVDSNTDNLVTVNGGNGIDSIEIGKTDSSLAGIESNVNVGVSSGADRVYIHSEADPADSTYSVGASTVAKVGYPLIATADSGLVAIYAGDGVDTFIMTASATNNRCELYGGGGDDVYDIRNTSGATVVVDGQSGFDRINLNSDVTGPATIQFETTQDLSRIDSAAEGRINMTGSTGVFLNTNTSDFEGDLYLETGFLIEHNSQAAGGLGYWRQRLLDAVTNVTPQVRSTFADSSAANDTIGYGYAQNTAITTLAGFPLVSGDLALRYTLRGDANLDGAVNFDDLLLLAQNYSPTTTGRLWTQGDFNLSGVTDFDDLLALAQNYGQNAASVRTLTRGTRAAKSTTDVIA